MLYYYSFHSNRFPSDVNTHGIDAQIMWGSAVVISPVMTEVGLACYYNALEQSSYSESPHF